MAKKRKDGRVKRSFTINGKRYYAYGRTVSEAKEKEAVKRQQVLEKVYQKGKELTVDKFHERWDEARVGVVGGATIRKQRFEYSVASRTPVDETGRCFGSLKVYEVERQNIKDIQRAIREVKCKNGKPRYSTNTVNGIIALLNHIFNDAVTERIISFNPVKGVKPLKRTEKKARDTIHRALTVAETKAFFEAAEGSWYLPLYKFMLNSGCRVGEAAALRSSYISEDDIYIKHTITKDEYGSYYIGEETKTSSGKRHIPYVEAMKDAVRDQIKANKEAFGNIIDINGCVFKSLSGGLIDETVVNRDIARICKRSGVERFTSHAFRDTFSTRAIESGMNPKVLQEILGHADIGITMNLYVHVMETTKENEMKMVKVGV